MPRRSRNPWPDAAAQVGRRLSGPLLAVVLGAGVSAGADAAERLPGPVSAQVLSVIDGDTIEVKARIWLDQDIAVRVRLAGIDAPEVSGECAAERRLAARARDFLIARLGVGGGAGGGDPARVVLRDVRYGKYAGRVLARVETQRGEDLAERLVSAGLARPYDGGQRRGWCSG